LDTKTQTVDARLPEARQLRRADRVGIRLKRDFAVGGDGKRLLAYPDDAFDFFRLE
jgi:hypothetical protein